MTSYGFVCGSVLLAFASVASAAHAQPHALQADYGRLPLRFEPNRGQADASVRYVTRGAGYAILFGTNQATLAFSNGRQRSQVAVRLPGAASVEPVASQLLPGATHYLRGRDASRWQTNIGTFARLRYPRVYPGIDLVYYGNQRSLEFDFELAPQADPSLIRLRFDGGKARLAPTGELLVETAGGTLVQHRPVIYQMIDGRRVERQGRYKLTGNEVSFALGAYDRNLPLVIDPVLSYSGYLGGSGGDAAYGVAVDSAGNAYIVGQTTSGNFPVSGALTASNSGDSDVFVTKLSPGGSSIVFSTYVGGTGEDAGVGIAVDSSGVYFTGHTTSTDFPNVSPVQQGAGGNRDGFAAKLNVSGNSLIYSTYIGGSQEDRALAIAVDSSNAAYIAGTTSSSNFPLLGAIYGTFLGAPGLTPRDAFVTKLSAAGALAYSTYLPGSNEDTALSIAVDSTGAAYVGGFTRSTDFPTANPLRASNAGGLDGFVTKLNPAGSALVYSTYLGGGADDRVTGIAVDADNAAYVSGWTFSGNFPTAGGLSTSFSGAYEGFVSKLSASGGSFVYSTYLGGNGEDFVSSIAVDSTGAAVVAGYSTSTDLPQVATSAAYANGRNNGAFVSRLNPSGDALQFSTYFGGASTDQANSVAVDANRSIYSVGSTISIDFPAISAFQSIPQGSTDAFAVKFSEGIPVTYTVTTNPPGLNIIVDGVTTTAPRFFSWAPGSQHTLNVPSPQGTGGTRNTFA
ncbi:MAG: SBBP repeat-containing protein, partial [Bryobacterales bacterium]|nr:SBBP repeat-containing protein [Bryobacterales bacterium]